MSTGKAAAVARKASRPIFVAATRQHVGKTSVSLALTAGLQKRFDKIGFLKPVGQQHLTVKSDETGEEVKVDKDVKLVREHFNLDHLDYSWMSPVIIPPGYTRDYIDGLVDREEQVRGRRRRRKHAARTGAAILFPPSLTRTCIASSTRRCADELHKNSL